MARNSFSPFSRYATHQRKTELTEALRARATADSVLPARSNWMACRRRLSSCAGVPGGLMASRIAEWVTIFHYLCNIQ